MKRTISISTLCITMMLVIGMISMTSQAQDPASPQYQQMKEQGQIAIPDQQPAPLGPITTIPEEGHGSRSGFYVPLDGTFTPLPANDDGYTGLLTLPFNFCFYGTNQNTLYLNNNGNISFGSPYSTYSPVGFPSSSFVMVAPFWGDVDTRYAGGLAYYKIEPTRAIFIWDEVDVYFSGTYPLRNTFQLIITDGNDPIIGLGNNVGFAYEDMQWTTGDASGGTGGFGGSPATVGINKGDGTTYALIGRFDHPGTDYDGPGGGVDGVDYLDYKQFAFSTCNFSNIPPAPVNFPGAPIVLNVGDNWVQQVQFLAPEVGQNVTTVVNAPTLPNLVVNIVNGNVSTIDLSLATTAADQGVHFIQFEATDNGVPIGVTTQYIELQIGDTTPVPLSNWPIIVAFAVMIATAVWIIRRRF